VVPVEYKIEVIVSRAVRNSARILSVDTGETLVRPVEYPKSVDEEVRFSPAGDRVLLVASYRYLIMGFHERKARAVPATR
jgi:hypothetical protein